MDTAVALPERVDAGRRLRMWWKEKPHEILEAAGRGDVTVAQAMADLSLLATATLLRDLTNPRVSDKERRKIALVMAPKLIATSRGRPKKDDPQNRAARDSLMGAYDLTAKTG